MTQETPSADRWLGWFLVLLPIAGAVIAPVAMGGEAHWLAKVGVGVLFGAGISAIGFKGRFVPPLSSVIAGVAVALLFASVAVVAVTSSPDPVGTILIGALVAGAMFWALTR